MEFSLTTLELISNYGNLRLTPPERHLRRASANMYGTTSSRTVPERTPTAQVGQTGFLSSPTSGLHVIASQPAPAAPSVIILTRHRTGRRAAHPLQFAKFKTSSTFFVSSKLFLKISLTVITFTKVHLFQGESLTLLGKVSPITLCCMVPFVPFFHVFFPFLVFSLSLPVWWSQIRRSSTALFRLSIVYILMNKSVTVLTCSLQAQWAAGQVNTPPHQCHTE